MCNSRLGGIFIFVERIAVIDAVQFAEREMITATKSRFGGRILSLSGIPESNWRLLLGKQSYYHYTNPAKLWSYINFDE